MAGVGLVGLSGSLIKDVVKEDVNRFLIPVSSDDGVPPPPEPIGAPEATNVLIGKTYVVGPSIDFLTAPPVGVFFILFAQVL
jgi:hypothetical protein